MSSMEFIIQQTYAAVFYKFRGYKLVQELTLSKRETQSVTLLNQTLILRVRKAQIYFRANRPLTLRDLIVLIKCEKGKTGSILDFEECWVGGWLFQKKKECQVCHLYCVNSIWKFHDFLIFKTFYKIGTSNGQLFILVGAIFGTICTI